MKSMFQFIAAAVCTAALTACGGGGPKDTTVVIPPQPDYSMTETKVGDGALVADAGDTVVIKYNGYLYNSTTKGKGDKVMSSADSGGTYTFTVGVGASGFVTVGWNQALLGMRAGGTRTAILPTNLAYNNTTAIDARTVNGVTYPAIPAYAALVYDFEMVSVVKAVIIPSVDPPKTTQWTDLTVGTGAEVTAGKTASVKYSGWLYDGTRDNRKGALFDSNTTSTTTLDVVVDANPLTVIAGFNAGLKGMKVGGKRTVVIPSDQAYGTAGKSPIPPNAALVFDIEVTAVK